MNITSFNQVLKNFFTAISGQFRQLSPMQQKVSVIATAVFCAMICARFVIKRMPSRLPIKKIDPEVNNSENGTQMPKNNSETTKGSTVTESNTSDSEKSKDVNKTDTTTSKDLGKTSGTGTEETKNDIKETTNTTSTNQKTDDSAPNPILNKDPLTQTVRKGELKPDGTINLEYRTGGTVTLNDNNATPNITIVDPYLTSDEFFEGDEFFKGAEKFFDGSNDDSVSNDDENNNDVDLTKYNLYSSKDEIENKKQGFDAFVDETVEVNPEENGNVEDNLYTEENAGKKQEDVVVTSGINLNESVTIAKIDNTKTEEKKSEVKGESQALVLYKKPDTTPETTTVEQLLNAKRITTLKNVWENTIPPQFPTGMRLSPQITINGRIIDPSYLNTKTPKNNKIS